MRFALIIALALPAPALAETLTLRSAPTEVTVYASGARVTRTASLDVPQGSHDILLPDLPVAAGYRTPGVMVDGVLLGTTSLRQTALTPQPDADPTAIADARAAVEAAEAALQRQSDAEAEKRLEAEAAEAQIAFLSGLADNEGLPGQVDALRDLGRMISAETLAARQQMLAAEQAIRAMAETRETLERELKAAVQALAALTPRTEDRVQMTLSVTAQADTTATVEVSYLVDDARWQPTYDVTLMRGDDAELTLKRGAIVSQASGENWKDVDLTLSTLRPSDQTTPSVLFPQRLRIEDPAVRQSEKLTRSDAFAGAPVDMEESPAAVSFDGPGVRYRAPQPASIANGADAARVPLDTLSFAPEVFARAVPIRDETAFLMARFDNDTSEPLLTSDEVRFYLDGALVGAGSMPTHPAGGEVELAFGPVEDLRLGRVVLDLNEGDRGIITRSNTRREEVRIDIDNLGTDPWVIELRDQVPYAEQEDLLINWQATPPPATDNLDDRRGILQWTFDLGAGASQSIRLTQEISWPEGMTLR